MTRKILTIIYFILAMILVSLSETYSITHKFFRNLVGNPTQEEYSTGMKISYGFLIHIILFSILVTIPLFIH
jgi:hypothetical protein